MRNRVIGESFRKLLRREMRDRLIGELVGAHICAQECVELITPKNQISKNYFQITDSPIK